jgi:hypothetical protein
MNNFYKLRGLVLLLSLSGCVGSAAQKDLARFFAERNNPDLRYREQGSYTREAREKYSNYSCEQLLHDYRRVYEEEGSNSGSGNVDRRIILEFAEQRKCADRIYNWRRQKFEEEARAGKARMDKEYKDDLRPQERRRERKERQLKLEQERRRRVLREIRNEK